MTSGQPLLALLMLLALVAASVSACALPRDPVPQRARISLADARDILNLEGFLPFGFNEVDAGSRGLARQVLDLPPDASNVIAFQSSQPFQLVFVYLRIVDSEVEQRRISLQMSDEEVTRSVVTSFFQGAAVRNEDINFTKPQIRVSYPHIGSGAVLGEGRMETSDYTLRMEMLWFRSSDQRVFVYVHSWHVSDPGQPVIDAGEEIEARIRGFKG